MSDAPETIWAKEGMPGYVTDGPVEGVYDVKYRRADLPAPDPMDDPRVKALVEAANRLSYCAQTTGGTAGHDPGLVQAVKDYAAALAAMEPDNESP